MQIRKHCVLKIAKAKSKIRAKSSLNKALPGGLLFFTFWPLNRK
jgi:hypothetical protein